MPIETRLLFCQRKVEFLEDFGSDINMYVFFFFYFIFDYFAAHSLILEMMEFSFLDLWLHMRNSRNYRKKMKLQKAKLKTGMTGKYPDMLNF